MDKAFYIPVEHVVAGVIVTNDAQFIQKGTGRGFFFQLLGDVPLHEIVGVVVHWRSDEIQNERFAFHC